MKDLQKWLKDKCDVDYSIEQLENIQWLILSDKDLTELHHDINKLTTLFSLDVSNNDIKSIDLNLPNLACLECANMNMVSLKLVSPKLNKLDCSNNLLTNLDLSTYPKETIFCHDYKLSYLNFDIIRTKHIHCKDNNFKVTVDCNFRYFLDSVKEPYTLVEECKFNSIL